jgi:hypothetical protein
VIVGGVSGAPTRVAKGGNNTVFGVDGSGVLGYKADPSGGGATELDDLTDVDLTGAAEGDVLTRDATGWIAAPPAGGGGASVSMWLPDAPPATAHASDDEFNDSTVTGWTEWDVSSRLTVAENDNRLAMTMTPVANYHLAGIFKARPSGDFTMYARGFARTDESANIGYGLMVSATLGSAPTTAPVDFFGVQGNSVVRYPMGSYTGPSSGTVAQALNFPASRAMYFRLRVVSNACWYAWSMDGRSWSEYSTSFTPGFTIAEIGLCAWNNTGTATLIVDWEFFRVVASTTASQMLNGRMLSIPVV